MRQMKIFLPVILIIGAILVAYAAHINPPEPLRDDAAFEQELAVEVLSLSLQDYSVTINSYGSIEPRTRTELTAQVSGQILSISDNFKIGASFNKGDVLIQLEDRDYIANVKIAQANLVLAQQSNLEEQARAEQAREDWKRLGQGQPATDLVLHIPQMETAKANLLSAEAELLRARIALERTKIVAPYDGRIVNKLADIGQFVSASTVVANIYATDYVEIRLPIKNNDLRFVNMSQDGLNSSNAPVKIQSTLVTSHVWNAHIDRAESQIDKNSQQLNLIAKIDTSFTDFTELPIIGQYITALIQGNTLKDVIVIPSDKIYQGSYVYIEKEGRVYRRNIELQWQNETDAIVVKGLNSGDNLVITPLGLISSGTAAKVVNQGTSSKQNFTLGGEQ